MLYLDGIVKFTVPGVLTPCGATLSFVVGKTRTVRGSEESVWLFGVLDEGGLDDVGWQEVVEDGLVWWLFGITRISRKIVKCTGLSLGFAQGVLGQGPMGVDEVGQLRNANTIARQMPNPLTVTYRSPCSPVDGGCYFTLWVAKSTIDQVPLIGFGTSAGTVWLGPLGLFTDTKDMRWACENDVPLSSDVEPVPLSLM